ncbi:MAG: hypothetical protein JSW47_15830 [Phycisphaerales bacterium]|nr:MAG: hypothetical protein JSW47_15830 [Phycisphaerales bacterium]
MTEPLATRKLTDDPFARVNWRRFLNPDNGLAHMAWQPGQFDKINAYPIWRDP